MLTPDADAVLIGTCVLCGGVRWKAGPEVCGRCRILRDKADAQAADLLIPTDDSPYPSKPAIKHRRRDA